MLEQLSIAPIKPTVNAGKIALIFHRQLSPPKRASALAGIARARAETRAIVLPEVMEIIRQVIHRILGDAPTIRVEHIR